jgi:hypothetical protein
MLHGSPLFDINQLVWQNQPVPGRLMTDLSQVPE